MVLDFDINRERRLALQSNGDDLLTSRLHGAVAVCSAGISELGRRTSIDTLLDGDGSEVLGAVVVVVIGELSEGDECD